MASSSRAGQRTLIAAPDPVIFHLDRANIEEVDIEPPLRALWAMALTPMTTREYAGRVQLVFTGYEQDRRELYSIPQVRTFIAALNEQFPYWFHFSSKVDDSLFVVLMCLLPLAPVIVHDGKAVAPIDTAAWNALTADLFGFMNGLYDKHGLTPEENSTTTQQVLEYVRTFFG
jgi:hypothetical protein